MLDGRDRMGGTSVPQEDGQCAGDLGVGSREEEKPFL